MQIKAKKVLKYALLPGIIPMVRSLFSSGFGQIAFFMAQIYGGARLLPATHPYLNAQNMGRYGISNVIIEAFHNLRWRRDNIDQISIFLLMVFGFLLLLGQFALLGFALFVQASHAGTGSGFSQFFVTPDTTNDIAHILMDRVFGIPDMFNSCVSKGEICLGGSMPEGPFPFPYHRALQDMLAFYSIGLCVIAVIIFLYYIVAVVVETAQSGTPFGRRFKHVWVPIRMVVAMALLIPISYGMNGAQLLTLNVAKWGSAFATNGWVLFVQTLTSASGDMTTPLGATADTLVATPEKPDPGELFQFYAVVATCQKAYKLREQRDIDAYLVKTTKTGENHMVVTSSTTWDDARQFYDNEDIKVVFGERNPTAYPNKDGNVMPWCGSIALSQVDLTQEGSVSIQTSYFQEFIRNYWMNIKTGSPTIGMTSTLPDPNNKNQDFFFNAADRIIEAQLSGNTVANAMMPNNDARNNLLADWTNRLDQAIQTAVIKQIKSSEWQSQLEAYGWAGAGIWYNRIAELNGALIAGISNIPAVSTWPMVMEQVAEEKAKKDQTTNTQNRFTPILADGEIELSAGNKDYARLFAATYVLWNDGVSRNLNASGEAILDTSTGNLFIDYVKKLFGLQGLFNMTKNAEVHPLAQLVTMGKYLLEASIRNIGLGAGSDLVARAGGFGLPPALFEAGGTFLKTIGMMTLSLGFVLYYVVPFLPFIYFFFQVGGWIKGLFEAMVGLPLWALAHIRIDGEGLSGTAALNGYFLILDIFLRPILIVFGMIGGIAIFAAQVQVLNEIFTTVVVNLTGFNGDVAASGVVEAKQIAGTSATVPTIDPSVILESATTFVDKLFYTAVYAIITYMMATSSFKLVYLVPNNMLRWMGSSVDGFGEILKDEPNSLVGTTYGSASVMSGQMGGALKSLVMRS